MKIQTVQYYVEGDDEKKLVNALKNTMKVIAPGKLQKLNVLQDLIKDAHLRPLKHGNAVVLIFDTDTNNVEILKRNIKKLPKLKNKIKSVHLCFTTDPFMYGYDDVSRISIEAIQKLNDSGIKCTVLTKGILPVGISKLSLDNEYGITLVSLNEEFRKEYEPNSATFDERIQALRTLHELGCKTWVSIEPYPTPNFIVQNINDILEAVCFCDKIIFGRIHYNKKASEYKNHKEFFKLLRKLLIFAKNAIYHIKNGTITE